MTDTPLPGTRPNTQDSSTPEQRRIRRLRRQRAMNTFEAAVMIVLIVLVVVATLFIARNFEHVEVDWVIRTSEMRLSLVMLGFLLTGVVIGWLIHWFSARAQRRQ